MPEQIPTNAVVERGDPICVELIQETTNVDALPGKLAVRGTTDALCDVCGNEENSIGVYAYEESGSNQRPETRETVYAINDRPAIMTGKYFWLGYLAANQGAIVKGRKLVPAAQGNLKVQTAAGETYIAIARESFANSAVERRILAEWCL